MFSNLHMTHMQSVRMIVTLVRRELRTGMRGLWIFFLCLVLGVGTIATVQLVSSGISTGLRVDGRQLLGGDIALRRLYRPADQQESQWFEHPDRLATFAQLRTMAQSVLSDLPLLVSLKAVNDQYPLFGQVRLNTSESLQEALEQRDDQWGAVAEATVLERLGLDVGDDIIIGNQTYTLRAVLDHEPDRISAGGMRLGARILVAFDSLEPTGLVRPGSMIYWHYRLSWDSTPPSASWLAEFRHYFQQAGWRIRDATNAVPQLTQFIWRFTTLLTFVGLAALLIGGVGMTVGIRGYLETKHTTLAIFKCLGATRRMIFWVFFLSILIIAMMAIVVGLATSIVVAIGLTTLLADILPGGGYIAIDVKGLALAACFGLLTVVTFSVWPLALVNDVSAADLFRQRAVPIQVRPRRAVMITIVLSAIAMLGLAIVSFHEYLITIWFVGGFLIILGLFRLAAWAIQRMATTRSIRDPRWRLAMTNLYRPGNSTARIMISLGLGLTILVAVGLIEGNFIHQVQQNLPDSAPDFFFIDIQPDQYESFKNIIETTPQVSIIDSAPSLRGRIVDINGVAAQEALVNPDHAWLIRGDRGITFSAQLPRNVTIIKGEWWLPTYSGPPQISIYRDIAEAFNIGVGDRIGINILGRTIPSQIANIRDIDFLSLGINFTIIFSPGLIERAPFTYLATVRATAESEGALLHTLAQRFSNISAIRVRDALTIAHERISTIGFAVRVIVAVLLVAGILVLTGTISADQRRRVYSAIIFKVLGATRLDLVRAYLLEYSCLGILTALLAAILGTIIGWAVLTQILNWPWIFLLEPLIIIVTLTTLGTIFLGFLGTWRALGSSAMPILRNE